MLGSPVQQRELELQISLRPSRLLLHCRLISSCCWVSRGKLHTKHEGFVQKFKAAEGFT